MLIRIDCGRCCCWSQKCPHISNCYFFPPSTSHSDEIRTFAVKYERKYAWPPAIVYLTGFGDQCEFFKAKHHAPEMSFLSRSRSFDKPKRRGMPFLRARKQAKTIFSHIRCVRAHVKLIRFKKWRPFTKNFLLLLFMSNFCVDALYFYQFVLVTNAFSALSGLAAQL